MILYYEHKEPKKVIIDENKLIIIKEALSSNVYHFTGIFAALKILSTNEMFCQSAKVGGGSDDVSDKYDFYISTTRTKSSQEGFGYSSSRGAIARIEFDGDKLNHNFHGEPINYWGGSDALSNKFSYMKKVQNTKDFGYVEITDPREIEMHEFKNLPPFSYIFSDGTSHTDEDSPEFVEHKGKYYKKVQRINPEIQHHRDNEIEDRLFTNKPIIDNIRDYIKRVDIFISPNQEGNEMVLATLVQLSVRYSSIVSIYDNLNDFDKQSENTINEKYCDSELWHKYSNLTPLDRDKVDVNFIANVCSLITLLDNKDEVNRNKALLLKKYGLEKYTSAALKKNNFWGLEGLIQNIMSDSQNVSKSPSRDGQLILKMLSDFLRKNGYKSLRDAFAKMKKEIDIKYKSGYDWDSIDTETPRTIKILEYGSRKYIINNDSDTDFWHIFDLDGKSWKYNFIDNFIYNLEGGYLGDTWKSVIRGGINTFKKYLQNLAHKKVTLNEMFSLFERLGIDPKTAINETIGEFSIYNIEGNYWEISNKWYWLPYKSDNEDGDEYIKQLFKKA